MSKKFIKLTAKVQMSDFLDIKNLLQQFNTLGLSITFLSYVDEFKEIQEAKTLIKSTKDRNEKAKLQSILNDFPTLDQLALKEGLNLDPDLLKHLLNMISYRYTDEFIFSQKISQKQFNSPINRKFLREPENLLVRKYQSTHKELVIIGSVCQVGTNDNIPQIKETFESIKDAVENLSILKQFLDNSIDGILDHEIIIDPIAAYFE